MSKVAIFPAAGALGSSIYAHLFKLLAPSSLILISRHPSKTPSDYLSAGVTTRTADYDSPSSLEHVFDGVDVLVLISYPSIEYEHRFEVHKRAIDAARSSGITHIFYTSLAFGGACSPESIAHVMQAHLATEKYLQSLTVSGERPSTFTAIREGIYSESFPMYTGFFDLKDPAGEVRLPHDGQGPGIAWAKLDELGEASARLVFNYVEATGAFPHKNQVLLLSGPKVWSLEETINLLGDVAGKGVKIRKVGAEEYAAVKVVRERMYTAGMARQWASSFEAVEKGETAVVSLELEKLLGRKPEAFETTVRAIAVR